MNDFETLEFMVPLSGDDWHHYHRIRNEQLFSHYPHIVYDPTHWTITHPAHFHFILKKFEQVLGVIHIELLDDERAAIRPFAIDAPHQNKGYGSHLLRLAEKWICEQRRTIIHLHARLPAVSFYKKAGYTFHPFPEENIEQLTRNCVDMMKRLG
jgi:GNAT superfamily N-acetyltransferase